MILEKLTQDFADLFAHDGRARVALWCDARAEFRDLLSDVEERFAAAGICLLAFDRQLHHGALWLKWAAEAGPGAGKKVVLWLPYGQQELAGVCGDGTRLDCLLEYRYAGRLWQIDGKPPTLFGFLRKHGVPLPAHRAEQDAITRDGPGSPLAKYVRHHLSADAASWKSSIPT